MDCLCASKGFCEQGDLASAISTDVPTILVNTSSVGDHVCTCVRTSKAGYTVRTKAFNKVISNFEAGEIREPIGGHLADYVDCPNEHVRCTLHPDVQARLYVAASSAMGAGHRKQPGKSYMQSTQKPDAPSAEQQGALLTRVLVWV